jgi:hypothetical protein
MMPQSLQVILDHTYLGVSGLQWLIALAIVLGGGPLLVLVRVLISARLRRLAARSRTDVDDFVVTLVGADPRLVPRCWWPPASPP